MWRAGLLLGIFLTSCGGVMSARVNVYEKEKTAAIESWTLEFHEDYETGDMMLLPTTGKYTATIPGSFITSEWDLMYFVAAVAKNGEGRMAPDMEQEMPYVIVPVQR